MFRPASLRYTFVASRHRLITACRANRQGDGCLLVFKRWPFALRKATFQHVKDHVLEHKRPLDLHAQIMS